MDETDSHQYYMSVVDNQTGEILLDPPRLQEEKKNEYDFKQVNDLAQLLKKNDSNRFSPVIRPNPEPTITSPRIIENDLDFLQDDLNKRFRNTVEDYTDQVLLDNLKEIQQKKIEQMEISNDSNSTANVLSSDSVFKEDEFKKNHDINEFIKNSNLSFTGLINNEEKITQEEQIKTDLIKEIPHCDPLGVVHEMKKKHGKNSVSEQDPSELIFTLNLKKDKNEKKNSTSKPKDENEDLFDSGFPKTDTKKRKNKKDNKKRNKKTKEIDIEESSDDEDDQLPDEFDLNDPFIDENDSDSITFSEEEREYNGIFDILFDTNEYKYASKLSDSVKNKIEKWIEETGDLKDDKNKSILGSINKKEVISIMNFLVSVCKLVFYNKELTKSENSIIVTNIKRFTDKNEKNIISPIIYRYKINAGSGNAYSDLLVNVKSIKSWSVKEIKIKKMQGYKTELITSANERTKQVKVSIKYRCAFTCDQIEIDEEVYLFSLVYEEGDIYNNIKLDFVYIKQHPDTPELFLQSFILNIFFINIKKLYINVFNQIKLGFKDKFDYKKIFDHLITNEKKMEQWAVLIVKYLTLKSLFITLNSAENLMYRQELNLKKK